MVLLLETAEVLELRARRTRDVAQVPVLLRRAEHRRREAAQLRERLAARGAARPAEAITPAHATGPEPTPDGSVTPQQNVSRPSSPGQRAR